RALSDRGPRGQGDRSPCGGARPRGRSGNGSAGDGDDRAASRRRAAVADPRRRAAAALHVSPGAEAGRQSGYDARRSAHARPGSLGAHPLTRDAGTYCGAMVFVAGSPANPWLPAEDLQRSALMPGDVRRFTRRSLRLNEATVRLAENLAMRFGVTVQE